ncbi:MAG: DUF4867 family protein [Ruminococcaceae bacterium]|nr:DUF4867 family protein [Oscillospiraceae bacterium]
MKIYRVTDSEFKQFGRVIDIDTSEIVSVGEKVALPKEGTAYVASFDDFEGLAIKQPIQDEHFGQLPVQMGFCFGHNNKLNALEWHKCSEVNIAVTDVILLLGDLRDVEADNRYDSAKVKAFKVCKGEAVEVYATTLHYCPIQCSEDGFRCVVVLPVGTNTVLDKKPNDPLIIAKNKWLIAHEDNEALKAKGALATIYGENYTF